MDRGKESESQRSDIDDDCVSPKGWAAPRGSAILGQPVGPAKQASLRVPSFKIDVISWEHCSHTRYYTRKNS